MGTTQLPIDQFANNDARNPGNPDGGTSALVGWCIARVRHGRIVRNQKYGKRWHEYTRLWRGFWSDDDKNTDSERSKLIAPALQQAIEMTSAEIEEAIFGKTEWFEMDDDINDNNPQDVLQARDQLIEDFDIMGVEDAISKTLLLGCIYGTGIAKINVVKHVEVSIDPKTNSQIKSVQNKVLIEPIRPDEFIIDPAALSVDEALFCAHEMVKPRHTVREKQAKGLYRPGFVGTWNKQKWGDPAGDRSTTNFQPLDDAVFITEYYGKVPRSLLYPTADGAPSGPTDLSNAGLVEAIVIIANEQTLLRAVENPFLMKDRPIVAYQHDTVPGEFWGRGVSEKGYNPQKALDAELRARVDALALMTAPMMGADITRLPRNPELRVRPGKTVFTRGRPSEVYEPVAFGNPAQLGLTFQHSGDLERMVQMGTGAMDSQTPNNISRRNETAGGMSMMLAGTLKRTKRTMQNIERQFLNPLIRKSLWRYMQFDPEHYSKDYKFKVSAAMGIMAKEVENAQLVQMLGFVPPDSPAHLIILKALFDNTASYQKKDLKAAMDALTAPPSPQQQQMQQMQQQLQMAMQQAQVDEQQAKATLAKANALLSQAKAQHEAVMTQLEPTIIGIQASEAQVNAQQAKVSAATVAVSAQKNQIQREANMNAHNREVMKIAHDTNHKHLDRMHAMHQQLEDQAHEHEVNANQQDHERELAAMKGVNGNGAG